MREERIMMMTIARKLLSAGIVAAAAALAACTTAGPGGPPSATRSPVEGSWIDAQGTGLSTLAGGSSIQIQGTSLIRQTPISFNCLLISTSQLNCTSVSGQNFVLTRRT
jgi:hypothetical protein